MPGKLLDHPLSVDLALSGVVEDVQPDEAGEQVLVLHQPLAFADRTGLAGTRASSATAPAKARAAP